MVKNKWKGRSSLTHEALKAKLKEQGYKVRSAAVMAKGTRDDPDDVRDCSLEARGIPFPEEFDGKTKSWKRIERIVLAEWFGGLKALEASVEIYDWELSSQTGETLDLDVRLFVETTPKEAK